MNPTKYFLLGLLSILMAMFSIACDEGDEDTWDEDNIITADEVRGGLLYDKWWKVTSGAEPTTDHPVWASQTGSNARTGSDTWRCKECHGWDYAGKDGAYGSGSHFTGFAGIMDASTEGSEHIFEHFSEANHDFSSVLTAADLYDLTKFVKTELIDVGLYIDLTTKVAGGDTVNGKALYENTDLNTGGQCISCHGADGRQILFHDTEGLRDLANDNPWETLHKIRFGHPGSSMPSTVKNGLSAQDAGDILAYAQTMPEVDLTASDAVTGGLLYDKWWVISGTEPTTDHTLWATQATNTRSGSTTWRCKECHGWDYQGAAGAYGSGSHYTGFAGVWDSRGDALAVYKQLSSGTDHDFSTVLTEGDIKNLTAFITTELIDNGLYIDLTTKAANGDTVAGQALYEDNGATGGACITCHGADGRQILFHDTEGVGDLANDNPWETLHKIRFGHPGSGMTSTVNKGLTTQNAVDILTHSQTLP